MVNDNTPKQSGSIIFWNNDNVSIGLNLPAEGSGESAYKKVAVSHSKIEMSDVPSASTIKLNYRPSENDPTVLSSITLLSTHRPASLNRVEYSYLLNTYAVGDFISEGLGLKVIAKKDGPSALGDINADPIMDCVVSLSESPPSELL